jgi:hypothetical protein
MSCPVCPVCEESPAGLVRREEAARQGRRSPVLVLLLVLVPAGLLGAAWRWRQEQVPVQERLVRTVTAKDGQCQLQVPAGWTQRHVKPGNQAVLMACGEDHLCVRVLSEPKAEFRPSMTLEQYGRLALDQMEERLGQCEVLSGPTPLVIDGRRALRCELHGTMGNDGVTGVFLHTVVEGRRHFHRVIGISPAARIERNRGQLEAVVDSFREVR